MEPDCRRQEFLSALAIRFLSLSDGTHRREFARLWAGLANCSRTFPKQRSESLLEAPMEDYQIAVTGPMLDAFNQMSLASFQEKTFPDFQEEQDEKDRTQKAMWPQGSPGRSRTVFISQADRRNAWVHGRR